MEYLIDEIREVKCSVCDKFTTKKCICKNFYCSIECQKKDWEEHKKVCKKQQEFAKDFKKFNYKLFKYVEVRASLMTFMQKQTGLYFVYFTSMGLAMKSLEENKIPFCFLNSNDFEKHFNDFYIIHKNMLSIMFDQFDIKSDLIVYFAIDHDYNKEYNSSILFYRNKNQNSIPLKYTDIKKRTIILDKNKI
jgi:hypothetical protein